jgi:hypothetical protein
MISRRAALTAGLATAASAALPRAHAAAEPLKIGNTNAL